MNMNNYYISKYTGVHTIGTLINNEETGKNLRNAAFGFYGIIMIFMMGGVIK